jgi:hypothetical protein
MHVLQAVPCCRPGEPIGTALAAPASTNSYCGEFLPDPQSGLTVLPKVSFTYFEEIVRISEISPFSDGLPVEETVLVTPIAPAANPGSLVTEHFTSVGILSIDNCNCRRKRARNCARVQRTVQR